MTAPAAARNRGAGHGMEDLILRTPLVLGAIYLLMVAGMAVFQRDLMYFPDRGIPSDPARVGLPEMKPVRLATADGLSLVAWWAPPRSAADPVVAFFHGNGGSIAGRDLKARPLLDAGFGLLLVEYRGYGPNPGTPSEEGLYADGRAALAFLAEAGIPARRIALYGESLGSGVAVKLAHETRIGAVVLEAPFTSAVEIGQAAYPFVPVGLMMRDRYESIGRIAEIAAPLLVVHGARDEVVAVQFGRRLFDAAREPKRYVELPQGGHNDLHAHGIGRITVDYLRATIRD